MNNNLTLFLSLFLSFVLTTSCNSSPNAVIESEITSAPIENVEAIDALVENDTVANEGVESGPAVSQEESDEVVETEVVEDLKLDDIPEPPIDDNVGSVVDEDEQRDDGASIMWDNLLVKYVSKDGTVNYKGLKADPSFALCISTFQMSHPDENWNEKKEECFWINAYNAFTVKLIVDNYPLKSITDLKDPWDQKFIKLKDETYSLNQIEHEILRPKFQDPRIHFAVNCASYSCPRLLNHAFMPMSLDNMLTQLAKDFLNDPKRNLITKEKGEVSQLFDWYKEDFTKHGDLIVFINLYSRVIMDRDAEITFMEYNWELNGK